MEIKVMDISELKHPEKNVRRHTEAQLKELVRSINMFGQIRPVVIDENNVILAGNGLVEAMKMAGKTKVEVLQKVGMTEKQKKKLMLADNKIFQLGVDDREAMMEILAEIDDFDVPGFDESLLKSMFASLDEIDEEIEEYGIVSPEEREEMERAGEVKHKNIEEGGYYNDPNCPAPPTEEEYRREVVSNYKPGFVVCPQCGQEIEIPTGAR